MSSERPRSAKVVIVRRVTIGAAQDATQTSDSMVVSRELEGAIAAEALRIRGINTRELEERPGRPGADRAGFAVLCASCHEPHPAVDDRPRRPRRALLRRVLAR